VACGALLGKLGASAVQRQTISAISPTVSIAVVEQTQQ
jgi:hypothetical protein